MPTKSRSKILVAVDFSDPARYAWQQAGDFASVMGAGLAAVHVLSPLSAQQPAERKETALRQLREIIGRGANIHVLSGDPPRVLLRLARDLRPDIIAIGTHGRTGLKRVFLGSVAEQLIRQSPVPVLTVRDIARPVNSILAPVKLTHYAITGMAQTVRMAVLLDASVTLFHVSRNSDLGSEAKKTLQEVVGRLPKSIRERCRLQVRISSMDPADAVLAQADAHDMISVVSHRKRPLKDLLFGTTAEHILRRSAVPVLSFPYLPANSPERQNLLHSTFAPKHAS